MYIFMILLRNKQLSEQSTDGTEERLYRSLLSPDRYEKDVRPTTHHSKPTNVTFGFLLNQIVEMDERNQVLTTRSWLNINWIDQRLMWNHSQWEGIKTIYIPHQRLWKPDIILVNKSETELRRSGEYKIMFIARKRDKIELFHNYKEKM
ncbi:Neurotransmitter-gated ion-channel ligand binding domain protein [Ancylostoma duodenale]|uniref:Neurotransmitter-gated ion-channel ligand binding domain protein n=1 Tax=Ancylostoma duodenale TaxID=51022 RepID=A0A0C2FJP9_9BILA|nr:Neurotransmitter-gated ion-channel ligand binding domain protein [Ancylostoma duodenale]